PTVAAPGARSPAPRPCRPRTPPRRGSSPSRSARRAAGAWVRWRCSSGHLPGPEEVLEPHVGTPRRGQHPGDELVADAGEAAGDAVVVAVVDVEEPGLGGRVPVDAFGGGALGELGDEELELVCPVTGASSACGHADTVTDSSACGQTECLRFLPARTQ